MRLSPSNPSILKLQNRHPNHQPLSHKRMANPRRDQKPICKPPPLPRRKGAQKRVRRVAAVVAEGVVAAFVQNRAMQALGRRRLLGLPKQPNRRLSPQWARLRLRLSRRAREQLFWPLACLDRARVHGSSVTTFDRSQAICCANYCSTTRRSNAFRIWSSRTCARC